MPISTVREILKKIKATGTVANCCLEEGHVYFAPHTARRMIREAKNCLLGSSSFQNYN